MVQVLGAKEYRTDIHMFLGNAESDPRWLLIRLESSWGVDQHARTKTPLLIRLFSSPLAFINEICRGLWMSCRVSTDKRASSDQPIARAEVVGWALIY